MRRRVESIVQTDEDRRLRMREMLLRIQWFFFGIAAACLATAASLPGFLSVAGMTFAFGLITGYVRYRFNQFVQTGNRSEIDITNVAVLARKQQRG